MRAGASTLSVRLDTGSCASLEWRRREREKSRTGTTQPLSPTMLRASPTSVATAGRPQAMPSARAFENPSPKAESRHDDIRGCKQSLNIVAAAQSEDTGHAAKALGAGANEQGFYFGQLHQRRLQVFVILHGIYPRNVGKNEISVGNAELGPDRGARPRVRLEAATSMPLAIISTRRGR